MVSPRLCSRICRCYLLPQRALPPVVSMLIPSATRVTMSRRPVVACRRVCSSRYGRAAWNAGTSLRTMLQLHVSERPAFRSVPWLEVDEARDGTPSSNTSHARCRRAGHSPACMVPAATRRGMIGLRCIEQRCETARLACGTATTVASFFTCRVNLACRTRSTSQGFVKPKRSIEGGAADGTTSSALNIALGCAPRT